jgi:hypothetical protein
VQIFHDSVKNVYRILSVDCSKVLINTVVTARMSFTKTSQKFCQWVDSKANHVYGLGFSNEIDLTRVNIHSQSSSIALFLISLWRNLSKLKMLHVKHLKIAINEVVASMLDIHHEYENLTKIKSNLFFEV